jgi:hypothetical protein
VFITYVLAMLSCYSIIRNRSQGSPIIVPKYSRINDLAKLFKTSTSKITKELKLLKNKKRLYLKYEGIWFEFNSISEVIIPSSIVQDVAMSLNKETICLNDEDLLVHDKTHALSTHEQQAIPVVALLGHFNHGKTTLLDALHGTSIVQEEAHQITQVCITADHCALTVQLCSIPSPFFTIASHHHITSHHHIMPSFYRHCITKLLLSCMLLFSAINRLYAVVLYL